MSVLRVACPLVNPEKGPRGRLVRPLCSLSPGTGVPGEGLFCPTCCLSSGVSKEAPVEGLSVGFVALYVAVNAQELTSKLYLS